MQHHFVEIWFFCIYYVRIWNPDIFMQLGIKNNIFYAGMHQSCVFPIMKKGEVDSIILPKIIGNTE